MGLAAIAALCAFVPDVSAEPTVLIIETRGSPSLPTLASQVELHSHGTASVRTQTASEIDPMAFADRASALVSTGEATVVVWVAPIVDGYLVFAAGKWPGRALIELIRVDAAIDPAELERTIALKVTGLLDSLLSHDVSARAVLDLDAVRHVEWPPTGMAVARHPAFELIVLSSKVGERATPTPPSVRLDQVDTCRRGDRAALEAVFRAHAAPLARLLTRIVGPSADVEDLLQDTFAAAILAETAQASGRLAVAVERYELVASRFPKVAAAETALHAASRIELRRGRHAAARVLLERYLTTYPSGRYADDSRRLRATLP